jgi:hypothetical protein
LPGHARVNFGEKHSICAGASAPLILSGAQRADAAEKIEIPVTQLSAFERKEQRAEVAKRTESELKKVLTEADAPKALRHVLLSVSHIVDRAVQLQWLLLQLLCLTRPTIHPSICGAFAASTDSSRLSSPADGSVLQQTSCSVLLSLSHVCRVHTPRHANYQPECKARDSVWLQCA